MNKIDLALSLIRPSNSSKLTDRAWVFPIVFASLIMLAAFLNKVDFTTAINSVVVLVGGPAAAEKLKDALIGSSAVKGEPVSQSVAVGNIDGGSISQESKKENNLGSQILNEITDYAQEQLPSELQSRAVLEQEKLHF